MNGGVLFDCHVSTRVDLSRTARSVASAGKTYVVGVVNSGILDGKVLHYLIRLNGYIIECSWRKQLPLNSECYWQTLSEMTTSTTSYRRLYTVLPYRIPISDPYACVCVCVPYIPYACMPVDRLYKYSAVKAGLRLYGRGRLWLAIRCMRSYAYV